MKILLTKTELHGLLSAAAAETLDEEIAQNIKEKVGEKEFMSVVGRISVKVIQHVTGKEKMNSELVKFCIGESALLFPEEQENHSGGNS